jgi:hypothetical protein
MFCFLIKRDFVYNFLWRILYRVSFYFIFHFCNIAEVAIIHKLIESNLAIKKIK